MRQRNSTWLSEQLLVWHKFQVACRLHSIIPEQALFRVLDFGCPINTCSAIFSHESVGTHTLHAASFSHLDYWHFSLTAECCSHNVLGWNLPPLAEGPSPVRNGKGSPCRCRAGPFLVSTDAMHEEIEILIQQERANVDALDSLLHASKDAFIPDIFSHLQLAKHLFDDAEAAWRLANESSPAEADQWAAITLSKIESAGRTLEQVRSLIEALSVSPQNFN